MICKIFILTLFAMMPITSALSRESSNQYMVYNPEFYEKVRNKKVSLSVVDVDIKIVLRAIAKSSDINIVLSDEIEGKTSLRVVNTNPIKLINSVVHSKGYSWYIQDRDTVVITAQHITHTFVLKHVHVDEVYESLKSIVSAKGSISYYLSSNSIIVYGPSSLIHKVAQEISRIDKIPRQVLVKTKILEVDWSNDESLGVTVSWDRRTNDISTNGFATNPLANGLLSVHKLASEKLSVVLNALEKKKDVNVKAEPMLIASNNKEARILVGERLGYKVTTQSPTNVSQETIEFLEVGTKLFFTPTIGENDDITFRIHPEVSTGSVTNNIPNTQTTETTTVVTVNNGQTIVIAGLINEREELTSTGVPFLQDLPIFGIAFRKKSAVITKKELIVFMTPYIIDEDQRIEELDSIHELKEKKEKIFRGKSIL